MVKTSVLNSRQGNQELANMELVALIAEVLESGMLSMAAERKIQALLKSAQIDTTEIDIIDEFLEALHTGKVQAIA